MAVLEATLQDLRQAVRALRRAPGFAAIVVATLALGIAVTLTMLGVTRAVLWRPLPYPDPERIVVLRVDARGIPRAGATIGEVRGLRERSRSLRQVSTLEPIDASLDAGGELERVPAARVSDDLLPLLGARPVLGRALDARRDTSAARASSIVISDALWRRRFAADPAAVGRVVRVDDLDVQIVGVLGPGLRLFLPPAMSDTEQVDVFLPYGVDGDRPYRGIPVAARLAPGVTLEQAEAELATLVPQFVREQPESHAGGETRFALRPLHEEMTRESRPGLLLLLAAAAFVLLIACTNVANLMLARGASRQRELAVRRALGAPTLRIVRQLLAESLVLAAGAGVLGLACAGAVIEAIVRSGAVRVPLQSRIAMDWPETVAAVALSVVTSLLFGALPGWRLATGRIAHPLGGGRAETAGVGARRLQRLLVVAEVALSIVPLACGGLMLRSFLNLRHAPLGFEPSGVVTARLPVDFARLPELEQRFTLLQDAVDRVAALSGVEAVGAADPLPLAEGQQTRRVGRADQPEDARFVATQQSATPGYLGAIGTPLVAGRDFTSDDVAERREVTIVDATLARRLWPTGAVGQRLSVFRTGRRQDLEVVGVTAPVRATRVRDDDVPHFMIPFSLYPAGMSLVVRTRQPAERMTAPIVAAIAGVSGARAAFDVRPLSAYVSESTGDTRLVLLVLAAFAGASVLLAAGGLYGTLAYLTDQRTREFGIRLALGSTERGIVAIVVREGAVLAAVGSLLGLAGVAAATGAIRELLYGVRPLDGITLAGVAGVVAIVALGAAAVPAFRAGRLDPQTSLRGD